MREATGSNPVRSTSVAIRINTLVDNDGSVAVSERRLNVYIDEYKKKAAFGINPKDKSSFNVEYAKKTKIFIYSCQMDIYDRAEIEPKEDLIADAFSARLTPSAADLKVYARSFHYRLSGVEDDNFNWYMLSKAVYSGMEKLHTVVQEDNNMKINGIFSCPNIGSKLSRQIDRNINRSDVSSMSVDPKVFRSKFHKAKYAFLGCSLNYWVKELVGNEAKNYAHQIHGSLHGSVKSIVDGREDVIGAPRRDRNRITKEAIKSTVSDIVRESKGENFSIFQFPEWMKHDEKTDSLKALQNSLMCVEGSMNDPIAQRIKVPIPA